MAGGVTYICCGKDCGLDMTNAVVAAFAAVSWGADAITAARTEAAASVIVTCANGHSCRYYEP